MVGLLLVVAAAGKSALIPFSGWLPRAMEGPTPSSAVFYGALSVHLGAFLLFRVSPLLDISTTLAVVVTVLGLTTAILAYLACGVQTDIKATLSFASLSQVGIIVAEIGLGLRYLALVPPPGPRVPEDAAVCPGHQPSARLSVDGRCDRPAHTARGARSRTVGQGRRSRQTVSFSPWSRGYLDRALLAYIVRPFIRTFRWCDTLEHRWTDFLAGEVSRESDQVKPHFGAIEEFS